MQDETPSEEFRNFRAPAREVRRQKRRRKIKIAAIAVLVTILLGIGGGFFWLRSIENKLRLDPKEARKVEKIVAEPQGNQINIVLAGTDKRPGLKSSRADSIVFIRADTKKKKAYLVSIPRDTRVNIPGHGMDKINHAWPFGGAPLLIETISDFLDMPVNYFFQVDFAQFEKAVNGMGGVDFASEASWYDGELGVQVRAGLQHRNGKEALALVRNRHHGNGGGGDLPRVSVQQDFLKAMLDQSIGSYTDVPRAANVVASYVNTNMTLTEMLGVGRTFAGNQIEMETLVLPGRGSMINGVSYIVPDLEAKEKTVEAMLNNKPFPKL